MNNETLCEVSVDESTRFRPQYISSPRDETSMIETVLNILITYTTSTFGVEISILLLNKRIIMNYKFVFIYYSFVQEKRII